LKDLPLIGIMVPRKKDRKKILELYQEFRKKNLKMRLCSFTPANIDLRKKKIKGIIKSSKGYKEATLDLPDAVYNRCYNKSSKKLRPLERMIGEKYFNKITHFNKWDVYRQLEKSELKIFTPKTFLYDASILPDLLEAWKLLYLKPVYGNKGKNVYRLEQIDSGSILISSHSLAPRYICERHEDIGAKLKGILGEGQFIMQRGIRSRMINQCLFDLRLLVQKDITGNWLVTSVVSRVAYEGFFNPSILKEIYDGELLIPQFFTVEKGFKLLKVLNNLSIKAAELVEKHIGLLGEISVDFILDETGKPWIIEINGKPQKVIYQKIESFQHRKLIYQRPLEYAYYLSQLT